MSNTAPAPDKTKKKGKSPLLLIGAVVVLLGGGGAAYWTLFAKGGGAAAAAPAEAPEPAHAEPAPGVAIPLETFIVNLAGSGRSHFLRVTLSLVVEDEKIAAEVGENEVIKMRVRSGILELLAQQAADSLVTPEGKAALKTAIAESATHAFAGLHVTDVLFSEFVVQF